MRHGLTRTPLAILLSYPAHRKATTANFVKAKKPIHFMRLHETLSSGSRQKIITPGSPDRKNFLTPGQPPIEDFKQQNFRKAG